MRIAAWVFLLCTLASAVGVFVPAVELRVGGHVLTKKAAISLWQAHDDKELVRRFLGGYNKSGSKKYGAAILGALSPKQRAHGHLDDVHDAMDTLDSIDDADVVSGARLFTIFLWVYLALHAAMAILIFSSLMNDAQFRKRTLGIALGLATVVAAIGVAIHWACGEAVFEANDEVGVELVGTSTASWLCPLAACGALVALITLTVIRARTTRTKTGT